MTEATVHPVPITDEAKEEGFSFSKPIVDLKEQYDANEYSQYANNMLSTFIEKDGGFALVIFSVMAVAWIVAKIQRKRAMKKAD